MTIANGSDFDDFAGLEYHASDTLPDHARGLVLRQARPAAVPHRARAVRVDDVVVRFLGDFRSADREWAEAQELGDRLELIPYAPRRRSLELQRDSEALLLLIPEADGRGQGVLSREGVRVPRGRAADPRRRAAGRRRRELIRDAGAGVVVAPDDVDGIVAALRDLRDRWRAGALEANAALRGVAAKVSRRTRVEELARLLERVE